MKAVPLEASIRQLTGKKVSKLREEGVVPATVYGNGVSPESLSLPIKDFIKIYNQVGETGLVDLKYKNFVKPCLISEVSFHPITRQPLHVQFHAVKLTEKIKANIPLEVVGESPVVSEGTGLLLQTLNEVEVEAFPTDLPEKISIDVSLMVEVGQQLTVGDLGVLDKVEILTPKEELVIKVVPAVSEEAKKEAEEAKVAAQVDAQAEQATENVSGEPTLSAEEAKKEEAS